MVQSSQDGIETHTDILKSLIEGQDEKDSKEHCKGMEGLVAEATKHIVGEGPEKGPLLDAVVIAQYQRLLHYGLAGFGTTAAYAKALGLKDDFKALSTEIYGSDRYNLKLGDTVNQKMDAA